MRKSQQKQQLKLSLGTLAILQAAVVIFGGCQLPQLDLADGDLHPFGNNRPLTANSASADVVPTGATAAGAADARQLPASNLAANVLTQQGESKAVAENSPSGEANLTASIAEDLNRAHREAALHHDEQAEIYYRRVLERQPDQPVANHRLAVLADRRKDFATSEALYLTALRSDGKNPDLLNDLGYSYFLQGRRQESERWLLAATQINPTHERALRNLSRLYAAMGDYDRSLEALKRAVGAAEARIQIARLFPNGRPEVADGDTVIASFEPWTPAVGEFTRTADQPAVANRSETSTSETSTSETAPSTSSGDFKLDSSYPARTPTERQQMLLELEARLQRETGHAAIPDRLASANLETKATERTVSVPAEASPAPTALHDGSRSNRVDRPSGAQSGTPLEHVADSHINDLFSEIDREERHESGSNDGEQAANADGVNPQTRRPAPAHPTDGSANLSAPSNADPLNSMPLWPARPSSMQNRLGTAPPEAPMTYDVDRASQSSPQVAGSETEARSTRASDAVPPPWPHATPTQIVPVSAAISKSPHKKDSDAVFDSDFDTSFSEAAPSRHRVIHADASREIPRASPPTASEQPVWSATQIAGAPP